MLWQFTWQRWTFYHLVQCGILRSLFHVCTESRWSKLHKLKNEFQGQVTKYFTCFQFIFHLYLESYTLLTLISAAYIKTTNLKMSATYQRWARVPGFAFLCYHVPGILGTREGRIRKNWMSNFRSCGEIYIEHSRAED